MARQIDVLRVAMAGASGLAMACLAQPAQAGFFDDPGLVQNKFEAEGQRLAFVLSGADGRHDYDKSKTRAEAAALEAFVYRHCDAMDPKICTQALDTLVSWLEGAGDEARWEAAARRREAASFKAYTPESGFRRHYDEAWIDYLEANGRDAEVEPAMVAALTRTLDQSGPLSMQTAAISYDLGKRLYDQARYGEAIPHLRRYREAVLANGKARDLQANLVENYLMTSLEREGQYAEVSLMLQPELERLRARYDNGRDMAAGSYYAGVLTRQAGLLAMIGQRTQSDALFAEALDIRTRANGPDSDEVGFVHNQTAYFWNINGRFAEAEPHGKRAAEIYAVTLGEDEIGTAKARYNYATALLGQGNAKAALPYYEAALPVQLRVAGPDHPDLAILLTTTARALNAIDGRSKDALRVATQARDIVMRRRQWQDAGGGTASDPAAAALASSVAGSARRDPLAGALDVYITALWQAGHDAAQTDAAYQTAQQIALTDAGAALTQSAVRSLAGDGPLGALIRERQDIAAVAAREDKALGLATADNDAEAVKARRAALDVATSRLLAIDARIAREFPGYGQLVRPTPIDMARTQASLGADEALLLMLPADGAMQVFVVTDKGQQWQRVGALAEIEAMTARLRCRTDEATCSKSEAMLVAQIEDVRETGQIDDYYPRYDRGAAWQLYQQLLGPFETLLKGKSVIYVNAIGPVAALPLAALVTAPPEGDANAGDAETLQATPWLGNRHAFVTLPSVSALALPRRAGRTEDGGLVGYGAPVLTGSDGGNRSADGSKRRRGGNAPLRAASYFGPAGQGGLRVDVEKLRQLTALPGTERELKQIAAALGGKSDGVHLGNAATEGAVKRDTALPGASVVVFATHGLLPGEMGQAAEPGLVLTPPRTASEQDDGLLTASEAAALSLSARWVILSACNTATAEGGGSAEALSGLARSFLYAGADSLMASHWRVADDASAVLTVRTLSTNRSGQSQARSLQAAMTAIRAGKDETGQPVPGWQPQWAHPSAWAPFTLITHRDQ